MSPFEIFIRDCITRLRKIAASSRGDASLDDLKNEAWVISHELAAAGNPLDLTMPEDQESMLSKLYGKFIKKMKTRIGFALRLDKDWDKGDDESGPRLIDMLAAAESSDPLKALELREAISPLEMACQQSYSQATAYALCLNKWHTPTSLAIYLCIAVGTLRERIKYWKAWVEYQPSLFDGIERIGLDFTPLQGVPIASPVTIHLDGDQRAWEF